MLTLEHNAVIEEGARMQRGSSPLKTYSIQDATFFAPLINKSAGFHYFQLWTKTMIETAKVFQSLPVAL